MLQTYDNFIRWRIYASFDHTMKLQTSNIAATNNPNLLSCEISNCDFIMTSPNGNIFRVTAYLYREFDGRRWIPFTKASDAELWCFRLSRPEQTAEKTIETPVIWDANELFITSLWF